MTTQILALHIANMVEGGLTPLLSAAELADLRFSKALYANAALRGAMLGTRNVLNHLAENGDTRRASELMVSWEDRQSLGRKSVFDTLELQYAARPRRSRLRFPYRLDA